MKTGLYFMNRPKIGVPKDLNMVKLIRGGFPEFAGNLQTISYAISTQIGTTLQNVTVPGNVIGLLGLSIQSDDSDSITDTTWANGTTLTLNVNTANVITNLAARDACPYLSPRNLGFFPMARVVKANDQINLSIGATQVKQVRATFFFACIPNAVV